MCVVCVSVVEYVGVGRVGGCGWSMWVWELHRLGGVCMYVGVGGSCGCVWMCVEYVHMYVSGQV